MSFEMVARELINSPNPDVSMLNKELLDKLDDEGWKMFKKEFVLESIKLFLITKNYNRLKEVGKSCITKGWLELAYYALKDTKDFELLTDLGLRFISEKKFDYAKSCFILADNEPMLVFVSKNF